MPYANRMSEGSLLRIALVMIALLIGSTPRGMAQPMPKCVCSDPGADVVSGPDTVFHVVDHYDVALCGRIDRSIVPFVYSNFTLRSCGYVRVPLRTRNTVHGCHISVFRNMLVVDEFRSLPTGPDMVLVARPCWRSNNVLRENEDTAQYAINEMRELIADLPKPTPQQAASVQTRWDALPPSIYWMDQELLGQVFLCAVYDISWFSRFSELRGTYRLGGPLADYYDELLEILHAKRAGQAE